MIVELDIRILVRFCALAAFVQGGLSLIFSSHHSNTRGLRPIGFSGIVMAVALIAMSADEMVPELISVVVAHLLTGASLLLVDRGVRVFQRETIWDPFGWMVVGLNTAGLAILVALTEDLRPRILLLSCSNVILMTRLALRLHRGARKGGTPAHRITEGIFWIFAGIMGLRFVVALASPSRSAEFTPDVIQLLTLPAVMLLFSAATLGFWSMEVQRLHGELMNLAATDEMTGILNRRAFLAQCEQHFTRQARSGKPLSLVVFDLDHFKRVNDNYGHPAGDEVLRQAVRILEAAVRPGDQLGRFGGEEFAVLLPDACVEQALLVAERAREAMASSPFPVVNHRIAVTTSAGVASWPIHGGDLAGLFHAADAALYAAKAAGRNCVREGQALPECPRPVPVALTAAAKH